MPLLVCVLGVISEGTRMDLNVNVITNTGKQIAALWRNSCRAEVSECSCLEISPKILLFDGSDSLLSFSDKPFPLPVCIPLWFVLLCASPLWADIFLFSIHEAMHHKIRHGCLQHVLCDLCSGLKYLYLLWRGRGNEKNNLTVPDCCSASLILIGWVFLCL